MRPPIYVRALAADELATIQQGLRSSDAFSLRRCQILLASAHLQRPPDIAAQLGCAEQTVRNTLHDFNARGLPALQRHSSRPKTIQLIIDQSRVEQLQALLHRSPRDFGHPTSFWTLDLAAQVCADQGITPYQVSPETLRQALLRLGLSWRRAKHWITSPDPDYAKKNAAATG